MLTSKSRYANLPDRELRREDGDRVVYKARRFLPQADRLRLKGEASVRQNDRLDLIAARTLEQPLLFWRIADANDAMDPFELVVRPNRVLRVPVPQVEQTVPPL